MDQTSGRNVSTRRRAGTGRRPVAPVVPTAFVETTWARRPELRYLTADGIARLTARGFELLEGHGVTVTQRDAYGLLLKAGATAGDRAKQVRLPRALVEEALKATPKRVALCGKSPEFDLQLPRRDNGFVMRTGTGAHGFVDPMTAQYRNLDLTDVDIIAAVANGLDQVGFIAHPFVHGVPELTSDIRGLARLIARTSKHVWMQPYNKENVGYLMRLAVAAAGGEAELRARPIASCIACSFTPLEFKVMDIEVIMQCGRYGVPIHACSLPSAGGTAPITVPGMVLMAAAEIVAMVTMAHVLAPGTPVIATPLMFTLDMRTGRSLQSCAESLQAAGMAAEFMKRGLSLVTHTYGAGSDTPDVDGQSMAERALIGETVALAGADILGGVGQLECATVFSPVQAVLDNELGAMLRRLVRAPEIDDESLNWSEVSAIRAGGHFLDSEHTLRHCRSQLIPQIFRRDGRDDYEKSGRRTAFNDARRLCNELVSGLGAAICLPEDQCREIERIVAEADRDILAANAESAGARAEI